MAIKVKVSDPQLKVPREENPRTYITGADGVMEVEDSAYYRRRIIDGELIEVDGRGKPVSADGSKA
jgi:hypothetical protein